MNTPATEKAAKIPLYIPQKKRKKKKGKDEKEPKIVQIWFPSRTN